MRSVAAVAFIGVLSALAGSAVGARPATKPTKEYMLAQTRTAVTASRARLTYLEIRLPNRRYDLRVSVDDPAAFILHRAESLLPVIAKGRSFRFVRFVIRRTGGKPVFWVTRDVHVNGYSTAMYVDPELQGCVEPGGLDFGLEIDPDNVAPPCPAP